MSLVKKLTMDTMDKLIAELQLEQTARTPLRSAMAVDPVGEHCILTNSAGYKLVYIGLSVPMITIDSHMVFCFTPPHSILPHFTLDAIATGGYYAFHLDQIPKCDLAVNLAYMKRYYHPLNEAFSEVNKMDGLEKAHLSPTQLALMSPWMLAYRASQAAMEKIVGITAVYLDHWLQTIRSTETAPDILFGGEDLAARDLSHRKLLFSPEIDPVWAQVERMLQSSVSDTLRQSLLC